MNNGLAAGELGIAITNAPSGLLKQLDPSMLAIWVVAEDGHREAAEKIARYGC